MRTSAKDIPWYVADFETTGENEYKSKGSTRVWLYAIANRDCEIATYGDSIEGFMEWLYQHPSSTIYFHNLRFDGSFILNWLLKHNYPYEETLLSHSKKGYSTLIGEMGEFYQLKINFAPNRQVVILDSLKVIPLTVDEIAKSFGLPISKGRIDYEDYTIDDETLDYVFRDVKIVAQALKFFKDNGFNRMTIGSNAYNDYKAKCPHFNRQFPRLEKEFINEWRSAYRGGRTQVNPKYAGKILNNVKRYDINSMYPYVMAHMRLPYGNPIESDTPGRFKFELYDVTINFKLKKGHLPTLLKTGSIYSKAGDTYYTDSEGFIQLKISSIDLEIMKLHYDIYYLKYNKVLGFKTSSFMFRDWILDYYNKKSNSTGGLRMLYKLIINSFYGKFGSKCEGRNKIPSLGDDGQLVYVLSEVKDMGIYYLPVAIAVVSYAHLLIDNAIMETSVDNFVYCDTDSVHTLGSLPDDWVDSKELGKFKLEGVEEVSKYIRQKTYLYKEDNKWEVTCAGLPKGVKEEIVRMLGDDVINKFDIGFTVISEDDTDSEVDENTYRVPRNKMKLRPVQVPGGVILKPVPFGLR